MYLEAKTSRKISRARGEKTGTGPGNEMLSRILLIYQVLSAMHLVCKKGSPSHKADSNSNFPYNFESSKTHLMVVFLVLVFVKRKPAPHEKLRELLNLRNSGIVTFCSDNSTLSGRLTGTSHLISKNSENPKKIGGEWTPNWIVRQFSHFSWAYCTNEKQTHQ